MINSAIKNKTKIQLHWLDVCMLQSWVTNT